MTDPNDPIVTEGDDEGLETEGNINAYKTFSFNVYLDPVFPRPERKPIDIYEGETPKILFTVRDRNGVKQDLSLATITYRIGKKDSGFSNIAEYTNDAGVTIDTAKVTIDLNIADPLVAGEYWDELRIERAGNTVIASSGRINILQDIE